MILGTTDYLSPVPVEGFPHKERDGAAWTLTDKFHIRRAYADANIPANNAQYGTENLYLKRVTVAPVIGTSRLVEVTLIYSTTQGSGGAGSEPLSQHVDGQTKRTANASWQEVVKTDPRLVSSGFYDQTEIDAMGDDVQTIGIGGAEYVYEEYIANFAWTEAVVIPTTIGKTGAPLGMAGTPTAANWLCAGIDISEDGVNEDGDPVIAKRTLYRYSEIGWNNPSA